MNAIPDLLLPDRTILHHKVDRAESVDLGQCLTLEQVRDYNRKREELSQPEDITAKPSEVTMTFGPGGAHVRFLTPRGPTEPLRLLKPAFQQMAREVLPAHGGGFMLKSAALDNRSLPMITALWAMHAKECDRPMTYRTQLARVDGRVERVVRAMVTPTYAPYRHSAMLDAALGAVGNLSVVEARVADTVMQVRVIDPGADGFLLGRAVKTVMLYNSETGHRSAIVKGGMFTLVCTNGMGSWGDHSETRWRHVGDPQRIRREMPAAMRGAAEAMDGVLRTYRQAIDIFIDDVAKWAELELKRKNVSTRLIEQVKVGMKDSTSSKYGSLAGVVDGVTLIAQQQKFDTQDLLEDIAADLLRRGVRQAQGDKIKVLA